MVDLDIESIISTSQASKKVKQFYNKTVVFDFGHGIEPIAVTLDYLYAMTDQYPVYKIENYEAGIDKSGFNTDVYHVYPSYPDSVEPKNKGHNPFKFLNVIRELIFKYGLQHEYYKNRYGKWIDLGTIRPHFAVKNYTDNIFSRFFTGTINDDILESSIYSKVCDNSVFDCSYEENYFVKLCQVSDINKIPAAKYFVKDSYTKEAYIYRIERGDGTYLFEECPKTIFTNIEKDSRDSVHPTNSPRFSYQLANADTGTLSYGTYDDNTSHKCDDLLLTLTNADGTPYTDINNLLIILNGLVVEYSYGPGENQIYLKDVVKYAAIQPKSLVAGVNIDNYATYTTSSKHNKRILNYDIPRDRIGYHYEFDIKIYKWDNVSISSFIEPISTGKVLKTVSEETNKSYWLVNKLAFSHKVDKDKSILICGNTIMDKDSWEVLSDGTVRLNNVEMEFDILYAEIFPKLREYLANQVSHTLKVAPKLEDYLAIYGNDTEENINRAYEKYRQDMDEWKATSGSDAYHYPLSTFDVVVNQFRNRHYALIEIGNISEKAYDVNIIENREEIKLDRPAKNYFTNENWNIDDIVVMNGIMHNFVNRCENVFFAPETWYRHGYSDVFKNASAYKLQIVRRDKVNDAYRKLNYTELLRGPKENTIYYQYDADKKTYLGNSNTTEFEKEYRYVSAETQAAGYNIHQVYFTKEGDDYVIVPSSNTEFQVDKQYYICEFTKDYYIKK